MGSEVYVRDKYYPQQAEWEVQYAATDVIGLLRVTVFSPYWEANGVTFTNRDGYRIILQNRAWEEVRNASHQEENQ